jgi:3-oxoacyl-[acyl-carrier protein] reductase
VPSNPTSVAQWEGYDTDRQRQILESIATRRLGTPEDIANGVLFFAADEASWVTGQVLSIDGGYSIF